MKKIIIFTMISIVSLFLYSCTDEENFTVTYYLEGNQLGNTLQYNLGDKIYIPCASRDGYILDGWYTSSTNGETFDKQWDFSVDEVKEDLSLYAIWIPNE